MRFFQVNTEDAVENQVKISFVIGRDCRPHSQLTPQDFEGAANAAPKGEAIDNISELPDDQGDDWTTREVNRIARMEKARQHERARMPPLPRTIVLS